MSRKRKSVAKSGGSPAAREHPSFCTAAFRRHGIGYLDVVLAALSQRDLDAVMRSSPGKVSVVVDREEQRKLCRLAGYGGSEPAPLGFASVWYLHFDPKHDPYSPSDVELLAKSKKWPQVMAGVEESWVPSAWPGWRDGFNALGKLLGGGAFPEMDALRAWARRYGEKPALESLWHVINEAPVATQIAWYREASPLYRAHQGVIHLHPLRDIEDVEDVASVTQSMAGWLDRQSATDWMVNTWGTPTATQFGWHYLAWKRPTMKQARFVRCRTESSANRPNQRFRPVTIDLAPADPIGTLERPRATAAWASPDRQETIRRFAACLGHQDNFSMLVMGPRGSGKTRMVEEAARHGDKKIVSLNCASFADPNQARSELFGHVSGAFTGAIAKREGAFHQAKGGVLFLDEVHLLDPGTRGLLLTALQTNENGEFKFRPLGSGDDNFVRLQPIFGTNKTWHELSEFLPEDFLDRISQRTFELLPIGRDERRGAWGRVWNEMKFAGATADPADDPAFSSWLDDQDLSGNFRDLQRIAILVADWQRDTALEPRDLVAWLTQELQRRRSGAATAPGSGGVLVNRALARTTAPKEFERLCRREYAEIWAAEHQGSSKAAAEALRKTFPRAINEATFGRWKGGR